MKKSILLIMALICGLVLTSNLDAAKKKTGKKKNPAIQTHKGTVKVTKNDKGEVDTIVIVKADESEVEILVDEVAKEKLVPMDGKVCKVKCLKGEDGSLKVKTVTQVGAKKKKKSKSKKKK